jgi:UDP-glucose 4-epimerase
LGQDYAVTVVDDLSNSRIEVIDRIQQITSLRPGFFEGDVRDRDFLRQIFSTVAIDAVIHFAGLKAVGESVAQPLRYYDCNVGGAIALCQAMAEASVKTLIFSSSATVYGDPATVPIRENFPRSATNPYGASKLMIEDILADLADADPEWRIARLRYFNPVGAHESGLIGEEPTGVPNNLMPYVAQVAAGPAPAADVFGNDYPTPDGTGVRDYIHVMDLVEGHLAALELSLHPRRSADRQSGYRLRLLGTRHGARFRSRQRTSRSLTSLAHADRVTWPAAMPIRSSPPTFWDGSARRGIDQMCSDAWRWQQQRAAT